MARVIALMALAALGLTEAPVHEPVHDHHSDRLTSITGRYHASCEIRLIGSVFMIDALELGTERGDLSSCGGMQTSCQPSPAWWACCTSPSPSARKSAARLAAAARVSG